ncbi:hypothetical protein [Flavobacterium subsaxonicum]|uniref:hypothetical protein n=1 Tax=Flavobacterium subsaxonicum TaxID=426226 RepID=UPI000422577D|nr:hypothetical protein [Flavobacterium subsaxonicum]
MKKLAVLILLLFITLPIIAQERKPLLGRVVETDNSFLPVSGVFVINKATAVEVKTDATGTFSLDAKAGDVLTVYSKRTVVHDFIVNQQSFKDQPYVVAVKVTAYELKEVVIDEKSVTTESLNLVKDGQPRYTVAERRAKQANSIKPSTGLTGTGGVGIPTDVIANVFSGRKKMLKQAMVTEKNEAGINKINSLYTEKEIIEDLKIPEDYVQGFIFYAVEDAEFKSAFAANNNDRIRARISALALDYLALSEEDE